MYKDENSIQWPTVTLKKLIPNYLLEFSDDLDYFLAVKMYYYNKNNNNVLHQYLIVVSATRGYFAHSFGSSSRMAESSGKASLG